MKWFRSNIRHGSRLALLALAIQLVLSFGHFHGVGANAATASPALTAQDSGIGRSQPQPASNHETDDACAICAVMAMANTVLFASPPILLLPQAVELLYRITDAEFLHLNSASVAFQPRAPPAS
jgi:hypothetical protein